MTEDRPVRRSSRVRVAEFLADVGEGNVFTKLQLFKGVPGIAQADRRMRDLRELGWRIDNYKTDPRLQPDEYRLTQIGTRIDLGEQPEESGRPRISAARRREAIENAGFRCQTCGIAAGETYAESRDGQTAVLSVYFLDPTPPMSTELSNLRVECQRCHAGRMGVGVAPPTPDEVLARASSLGTREERRRLYRMMQAGRPDPDQVERVFAEWSRLGREERVEVMLKLAGALLDED